MTGAQPGRLENGRDQSHVSRPTGFKLAGIVRVPDGVKPGERRPAFIVMHGFGSNSSSTNVLEPCKMFEKLGYVTLRFDMPGCGESEGAARQSDLPRAGRGRERRADLPRQASAGRAATASA